MSRRNATVTLCHSHTKDLSFHTKNADILISATGKQNLVTGDMVKTGATVIDVGITRLPNGKITGDIEKESVMKVCGALTPVPGGVGPMTIAMLLKNTVEARKRMVNYKL
jgi:methylenetetrahydrofolate dehydrogenase (NADP+)/methenyltetrahydrofolate cyclohydrolase